MLLSKLCCVFLASSHLSGKPSLGQDYLLLSNMKCICNRSALGKYKIPTNPRQLGRLAQQLLQVKIILVSPLHQSLLIKR